MARGARGLIKASIWNLENLLTVSVKDSLMPLFIEFCRFARDRLDDLMDQICVKKFGHPWQSAVMNMINGYVEPRRRGDVTTHALSCE